MGYDRYDSPRSREWRSENDRPHSEDRGFFEKAGDEIASWFGDDDTGQRRDPDRDRDRHAYRDQNRAYRNQDQAYREQDRARSEGRDRGSSPMNWTSSDRDYRTGFTGYSASGRNSDPRFRSSPSRDYGDGTESGYSSSGYGRWRSDSDRDQSPSDRDYDRSQSAWGRDDYRRTSYSGSNRDNDRHYDAWKQRQMSDLDRDYDQYCRDRQDHFENDFGSWRSNRMNKRQILTSIQEHMDVVGSDGETVGKVDKVSGDQVILTKDDSTDNRHHSIDCSTIDTVEGDQVRLDMPAKDVKARFTSQSGRSDHDRNGDTNLENSFSGTYSS